MQAAYRRVLICGSIDTRQAPLLRGNANNGFNPSSISPSIRTREERRAQRLP
jgi:hypothetical protein